jgi:hypothetical protein
VLGMTKDKESKEYRKAFDKLKRSLLDMITKKKKQQQQQ